MTAIDELAQRRGDQLIQELMRQFQDNGGFKINVKQVGDVEQFRKAARTAARRIGITVHTGVSEEDNGNFVFAFET